MGRPGPARAWIRTSSDDAPGASAQSTARSAATSPTARPGDAANIRDREARTLMRTASQACVSGLRRQRPQARELRADPAKVERLREMYAGEFPLYEWVRDVMAAARQAELATVWVTNGYYSAELLECIARDGAPDAVNLDLKAGSRAAHRRLTGGELMPVLDALAGLRALGMRGANVTVPHKAAVAAEMDELSAMALEADAVNTVVRAGDQLIGHNTDVPATVEAIARLRPDGVRHRAGARRGGER